MQRSNEYAPVDPRGIIPREAACYTRVVVKKSSVAFTAGKRTMPIRLQGILRNRSLLVDRVGSE